MMQKVLIRVTMVDQKKSRTKAMQIAATVFGVESVALKGADKDQLEVIGEGIDTVELAKLLRKKVGGADLLSVGPAKEEKKPAAAPTSAAKKDGTPAVPVQMWTYPMPLSYPVYEIRESEPNCSIISSQLRRLCLSSCNDITSKGLSEMLKELPMLEELHLEHMHVSKQAIEVAGRCYPRLKSFKLNYDGYRHLYAGLGDQNALPIAENLRGLHHLQLIGNNITIDGLLAIIETCPHLESLDIWNCFNVANQLDPI
ncbi:hypothetical protein POM88_010492 [Heracleum sosnowskyi]|uniref:Uncharacterized protein n=1 Tax=Heracleum sosnowskyi TaxID=360622 RepID=A0AAD8IV77_9APIA|nr:hypothetical protein POM88_010492 [Heracleum sosnowskyi]